ncbi:MAG: dehydrogenase [Gammaproteobacteria bacterium]|nr:dehydrogenase [Gammaproteobacteria bacterium]MBU1466818.1 dehydrogenase [Gammaproteobacteria bacterium]MBU2023978.1 dehydrogenase [Gammaproteobacteria bacterium]MBU2239166.1 dehydrogenase [Gammaproteobacteria bacterium]MBU2319043.1 dehydrogenase [Gammaproteobacteria bacterium]
MTWIDLGDPNPKLYHDKYIPIQWDVGKVAYLPSPNNSITRSFIDVIDSRESQRYFSVITEIQLGEFLWHSCRTRGIGVSNLGFDLEHRASPSAGAIHPIHVVIKRPNDVFWWLYQPQTHSIAELRQESVKLIGLEKHAEDVLKGDQAVKILFLAEPRKTSAKYQNSNSLVWRDAGAIIGVMALIATAMDLSFCPLGITGEPWASELAQKGELAGVGLAFLGSAKSF